MGYKTLKILNIDNKKSCFESVDVITGEKINCKIHSNKEFKNTIKVGDFGRALINLDEGNWINFWKELSRKEVNKKLTDFAKDNLKELVDSDDEEKIESISTKKPKENISISNNVQNTISEVDKLVFESAIKISSEEIQSNYYEYKVDVLRIKELVKELKPIIQELINNNSSNDVEEENKSDW